MFTISPYLSFRAALRKSGERITVRIGEQLISTKAVVQNAGKNFMRKYDATERQGRDLGRGLKREKIAFLPYFKAFDEADCDIYINYRGKNWLVIADSVMKLGNANFYIWALLSEVSREEGDYYDEIA